MIDQVSNGADDGNRNRVGYWRLLLESALAGLLAPDQGLPADLPSGDAYTATRVRGVVTRSYGKTLIVHFAGRLDQIHFKLYAMVDQGGGRHETDLRALTPTRDELVAAARWSITQDPSPGYRSVLEDALRALGVDNADLGD